LNSNIRLITWLYENDRIPLNDAFIEKAESLGGLTRSVKKGLLLERNVKPIQFNHVTATEFMTWMVSLRTKDGSRPGYSTYNSHRSAFFNLFRAYGETIGPELASEICNHFKRD
jgi:hypothetical protein